MLLLLVPRPHLISKTLGDVLYFQELPDYTKGPPKEIQMS